MQPSVSSSHYENTKIAPAFEDQFDQSPRRNVEQKLHNIESSLLMYAQENGMAQRLQYITNRFPLTN